MKTVASLLAIIGVLLTRWTDIRGDESMCYKFCCEDNSNINLTNCCSEATSHLLPPRFYSFTCVRQLLELCASSVNDSKIDVAKQNLQQNCRINCTENVLTTSQSTNISVNWKEPKFWPEDKELPSAFKHSWKKRVEFILRMMSHLCVNTAKAPLNCLITYNYPVFTGEKNCEKKTFVCGLNAPPAYLVMKEGNNDIVTVVSYSAAHLWPIICICVTWTLISGVIIWLLVSWSVSLSIYNGYWSGTCFYLFQIMFYCLKWGPILLYDKSNYRRSSAYSRMVW